MRTADFKLVFSILSHRLGMTQSLIRIRRSLKAVDNTFTVLNYHRVNDFNDPFTIDSVPAKEFDAQMRHVSKYYAVLSLDDLYDHIESGRDLPKNSLAVTFDDGYEDNYTFARPILTKHRVPATVFLTVGCVNEKEPLWFDKILSAFKITTAEKYHCPLAKEVLGIETPDQRLQAAHGVLEKLKRTDSGRKKEYLSAILNELGVASTDIPANQSGLLTWDMIKQMDRDGISFGSHTMTHPIMTNLTDSDMEWELTASRQTIEHQLGRAVRFFAYPNGKALDVNPDVALAVRRAGYKAALTTEPIINDRLTDPYGWGRYKPWQNPIDTFAMALFLHGLKKHA